MHRLAFGRRIDLVGWSGLTCVVRRIDTYFMYDLLLIYTPERYTEHNEIDRVDKTIWSQ